MISFLNDILNFNREPMGPSSPGRMDKHDIIGRLFFLISNISEEQQFILLKQLLRDNTGNYLLKLIVDMTDNQRRVFLNQLESMTARSERLDNRKCPRKDCLISATIAAAGLTADAFILDISLYGAFVETEIPLAVGQEIGLTFIAPNHPHRLQIKGHIIWTGSQAAGVEFIHSTGKQKEVLEAFCEKSGAVYKIVS